MKRLFAAIRTEPDPGFVAGYQNLKASLRPHSIKWVEEGNLHLTMKFFGETEEERIPEISRILREAAGQQPSFTFRYNGLGIFGSAYSPRVIWAGVDPYDTLLRFILVLKERLVPAGFPSDRQNPVPHLTLGRVRSLQDRASFQKVVDANRRLSSGSMTADDLILFESILLKSGPEYHIVETFPFKK